MNLIVCVDSHWGIGNKGDLLVSIPADKRMFKELTTGKVVLGGRRTMEGLPGGTTLAGRTNIVLTGNQNYSYGDAIIVHNMEEALKTLEQYEQEDIFIIGGEKVYREFLPYCQKAYVTKVDYRYEADTFFPNLDEDENWQMTHDSDEQTYYNLEYYFTIYQRIKND
ncbi:MAG: dihydrofolate reductase [Butyribacter sp.]|nr:dihydrofolate reductase [bacterium]MDY3854486.1 dihydrofolate reductase [Butyribacter sp.]